MSVTSDRGHSGPLLSLFEAAAYLAIAPRTLRKLVAMGHVAVIRVTQRRIAFQREDLDQYIQRRRRQA